MPFGSVSLIPGIDVERTPTLLQAGYAQSQLIRFKGGLGQKYGGWQKYYSGSVAGVPRDLHAWEDLNGTTHLAVGATQQLGIITSGNLTDITPQIITSSFTPIIQAVANSTTVTITDYNVTNPTTYDSVLLNIPVSAGGGILSGLYPITLVGGTNTYNIQLETAAVTTNTVTTNAISAIGTSVLKFAATPSWVGSGMLVVDATATSSIPADAVVNSTTATTVTLSTTVVAQVGSGDSIVFTSQPRFTSTSGNALVTVKLYHHGLAAGDTVVFPLSTAVDGVTIQGAYSVVSVTDADNFVITANIQASSSTTTDTNGGLANFIYYINIGPAAGGAGYGLGGYGSGGYGSGTTPTTVTGTPITATDWTSDNWGEILLECPSGGGVYQFDPTGGFTNAGLVATAPPFNGGLFVSNSQQILVLWGSTVNLDIGIIRDPMLVKWSNVGDYTDFAPTAVNQAGSFRIPIGSMINGGMAVANQNLIWTDLDLWAMNYQGPPFVFGFNKIGAGAGLISAHAVQQLRGSVFWMGQRNFYVYDASGVHVLPCNVWDFVFQNLNLSYVQNIRAIPNTPFDEVGWEFPSAASVIGENDSYVKMNILEQNRPWDYGSLNRSAWIDQTVLGMPIGASSGGIIYQHETTNDADGQPMTASFLTGYFYLAEGEDFAFVDQVIPDMKWGTYSGSQGAQVQLSFYVTNFPGDTPTIYGPYTVTSTTEYISVRFRGRQMAVLVQSSDVGSFWRLGKIRYRYSPAGRR